MIPVCEPTFSGKEKEYALDCIETGWISSNGKYIDLFEKKFAEFCGTEFCASCCNGTAALHLALAALEIGAGDEVIIPTFTMIATCNAVIYTGATPVLVDSEPATWNIDISKIEAAITDKTKAIMVVHTYGHPVDMDPVVELARARGLKVIEDAAEAHGAEYKGRRCGSLGDIASFSFYGNKILTTGEGGAVTTSDPALAARARDLRNHCFGVPRFLHTEVGFNYRMTNIQAAIGLAQTENADNLVEARRRNAREYNSRLAEIRGVATPPEAGWAKNVFWMYGVLLNSEFGMSRDDAMTALRAEGVDTRAFFYPMHLQPAYLKGDLRNAPRSAGDMGVSESLAARGLYLPSSSHLTIGEIEAVAAALKKISGQSSG